MTAVGMSETPKPRTLSAGRLLQDGFIRSSEIYTSRPALEVGGSAFTYGELKARAGEIAYAIKRAGLENCAPLTAVFAYRSATAFAGVLGSLLAGNGYVPLNPSFPGNRTSLMLERSQARSIVVDAAGQVHLDQILENASRALLVILPECGEVDRIARRWPRHRFIGAEALQSLPVWTHQQHRAAEDDVVYLLFTSGSTGTPKGVAVAHRNVTHFIDSVVNRYEITEHDRFSQTFDMTFDLSVFDMFVAWQRGACVCCPSQKTMLNPASFVQTSELNIWFSVPSVALTMKRLGVLRPGMFPRLRWSLFCGEALPADLAAAWAEAAPDSTIENLYGPTELTIACMAYRWDRERSKTVSERNIVPIGYPLPNMQPLVVDEHLNEVAPNHAGELLMSGPQLSLGYWRDPEKSSRSFVSPPGRPALYYATGDQVRRPLGDAPMIFLGRIDTQIKVNGHRVELGEVEASICQEAAIDIAVAVGWPLNGSSIAGIEAFVSHADLDIVALRDKLKARLPRYAVPRRIHQIEQWPLNSNGKIDRGQLLKLLEDGL